MNNQEYRKLTDTERLLIDRYGTKKYTQAELDREVQSAIDNYKRTEIRLQACPVCLGDGVRTKHTPSVTSPFDSYTCNVCNGKGYINFSKGINAESQS